MSDQQKSGKLSGTDKTILIVVIILVVLFALIPLAIVAFILFYVAKPLADAGIEYATNSVSGEDISIVYTRSLKNIYNDAAIGNVIARSDCEKFEELVYDETSENIDFCSNGSMRLSIGLAERGVAIDAIGDDGAVSFIFNNKFTAYYRLRTYDDPSMISGNFSDYRLDSGTPKKGDDVIDDSEDETTVPVETQNTI